MDAAISFNIDDPSDADFSSIGSPIPDYNANNMVTQTNFTISVRPIARLPHKYTYSHRANGLIATAILIK